MPKANSDSVSFPGADGEPVIVSREEYTSDMPVALGEPVQEQPEAEEKPDTAGDSDADGQHEKPKKSTSTARKAG